MKKVLIIVIMTIALIIPSAVKCQLNDEALIPIAVYVPDVGKYISVHSILETKLNLIATEHGMSGSNYNPQFVLYPSITVLDIQRTTTPPIMTLVQLQINLYIADFVNDNRFASISFTVKGVGKSEEKAYMDAVKKINNNNDLQRFVNEGKQRIARYYDTMCEQIITEAYTLSKTHKYEEAMANLSSIPKTAKCFEESSSALIHVYSQYYTNNCCKLLQQAKAKAASRDMGKALMYISDIPSDCSCYQEALLLYDEIVNYIENQEQQRLKDKEEQQQYERQQALETQKWEKEIALLQMGLNLYQYQNEQSILNRREERAFEIARISAMNSFSISNGSVIQDYVNSQINPYW